MAVHRTNPIWSLPTISKVTRLLLVVSILSVVILMFTFHASYRSPMSSESPCGIDYRFLAGHSDNESVTKDRKTPAGVPMILHFVYKDTNVLEAYRAGIETCIALNANWTVMLWTDKSVKCFIHRRYPQYESVFYGFPHKIQRSDAIRYLILHSFGGVYMDLDMTCRQSLLASLSNIPCFLDKEREHQTQFAHGRQFSAMNSAMGCTPHHPFFGKMIDQVFNQKTTGAFHFPYTIFSTTGPGILTKTYEQWISSMCKPPVTLLSESYFSPRVNPRSGLYPVCRNVVASLGKKSSGLNLRESACLAVHKLGYERSDAQFVSNVTVAIHQFTHLGYHDQSGKTFNVLHKFPGIELYDERML